MDRGGLAQRHLLHFREYVLGSSDVGWDHTKRTRWQLIRKQQSKSRKRQRSKAGAVQHFWTGANASIAGLAAHVPQGRILGCG